MEKVRNYKARIIYKERQKYIIPYLHSLLGKVCETDRQKLQVKVTQDLHFFLKLTESKALKIWERAVKCGVLVPYTTRELDERFKTYSYDGVFTGEQYKKDYSDMGVGATYHNNKESGLAQSGRFATDRKENKSQPNPQRQRK